MIVTETALPGVKIIEPKVHGDPRGFFMETFQAKRYAETQEVERYRKFFEAEIEKNNQALDDLNSGPQALEKFGRETYYMKRDNEDVFIISDPAEE